jgi:hypothetical protein
MRYLDALNEKFDKQYGTKKDSKSADRHVTNPGESKAQHRADAIKFLSKHRKKKKKLPEGTIYERRKPGRTSYDEDEQEAAARGEHGREVQKSERASGDAGSGISRRLKSGEKSSYRGQSLTYDRTQTADSPKASKAPKGQGNVRVRGKVKKLAGPMGKLPDHTEYHRIGALMAEALGLTPQQMQNRKYYNDAMRDPKSSLAQKAAQKKKQERRRTDTSMPSKGTLGRRDDNDGLGKKRMAESKNLGAKSPKELFKDMGISRVRRVDTDDAPTSKAGKRRRPRSLPPQQRLQPMKYDRPEHEKADKQKSNKAARSARASRQDSHTVYKQIGMALAEVYSPKKHAKITGGGEEAAKRRAERMGKVMRGNKNKRPISPIAGVEAVDKPGVTLSRAAREYRAARDSGDSERPTNPKPSYSK